VEVLGFGDAAAFLAEAEPLLLGYRRVAESAEIAFG
jgi:hypothetical protein